MEAISREFGAKALYGKVANTPRSDVWVTKRLCDGTMGEVLKHKVSGDYRTNYWNYVAEYSNGFTAVGEKYLNESIEAYSSILGAQARTRISIVNKGAASTQTQDVFRKLVKDTTIRTSVTVSISNMRRAISDCNVTVNTAVSSNLWLIPSDLVIIKKRIPGYNDILY